MAYYFISDLHLSADRPATVGLLRYFLTDVAQDATHLFILGDFFDAWIGDDEDSPAAEMIKHILSAASSAGIHCYFQQGNRDFLVGERFAKETGFTLLAEQHTETIYGQQVLLMHGDSLCTDDKEYMQFRAQVRNSAWQAQILSLALPERRALAAQMRAQSSSMNSIKSDDIMDVNQNAVFAAMNACHAPLFIHGHTHRPAIHTLPNNSKRIVLGDWSETTGWYLKISEHEQNLVRFENA